MDELKKQIIYQLWQDIRSYDTRMWVVPSAWFTVLIVVGSSLKDMNPCWRIAILMGTIILTVILLMVMAKLDTGKCCRLDEIKELSKNDEQMKGIIKEISWTSKEMYCHLVHARSISKELEASVLVCPSVFPLTRNFMLLGLLYLIINLIIELKVIIFFLY